MTAESEIAFSRLSPPRGNRESADFSIGRYRPAHVNARLRLFGDPAFISGSIFPRLATPFTESVSISVHPWWFPVLNRWSFLFGPRSPFGPQSAVRGPPSHWSTVRSTVYDPWSSTSPSPLAAARGLSPLLTREALPHSIIPLTKTLLVSACLPHDARQVKIRLRAVRSPNCSLLQESDPPFSLPAAPGLWAASEHLPGWAGGFCVDAPAPTGQHRIDNRKIRQRPQKGLGDVSDIALAVVFGFHALIEGLSLKADS